MLSDKEDIIRRKTLATAALHKMNKIWVRKNKTCMARKLKLYNSLVKPILKYNSATWGLTKSDTDSLNVFHRKQLKQILEITWPHKITNDRLYQLTNTRPISYDITEARWKLFGHVIRLANATPAQQSMEYYFQNYDKNKKFSGRPRETLVTTLNKDIILANERDSSIIPVQGLKKYSDIESSCSRQKTVDKNC